MIEVILKNICSADRSIRYIDELQKFIEDDQWKKSLALEPVETSGDVVSAASKDSVNNVVPALVSPSKGRQKVDLKK